MEENEDIEVIEFSLDDEEINDLIAGLTELKETKSHFSFAIDEDNELLIHHEEDESEEEEECEDKVEFEEEVEDESEDKSEGDNEDEN